MADAVRQARNVLALDEGQQRRFEVLAYARFAFDVVPDQGAQAPVANTFDLVFVEIAEALAIDEIGAVLWSFQNSVGGILVQLAGGVVSCTLPDAEAAMIRLVRDGHGFQFGIEVV